MSLKDCINKMGSLVSKTDRQSLQDYLDQGLSDTQAVRALLIANEKNVIDIAARARSEGATVAEKPDVLGGIRTIQGKALEAIRVERDKLVMDMVGAREAFDDISFVEGEVKHWQAGGPSIDIYNDQELLTRLTQMFFRNADMFKGDGVGDRTLNGESPLQLFNNFRDMQVRKDEIVEQMRELEAQEVALNQRTDTVFSGETRNPDLRDTEVFFQTKKGSITFDETRKGLIRLGKARDLSTFLHESGHLYLEIIGSLAERPEATDQTRKDYLAILKYLGVDNRADIGTEQHEKWARSFEAYLREGKAPSVALQDAFNAFRQWLLDIYRKLKTLLDEPLSDDIRGVMDRLLATDEQIAEAERVQEYVALFANADDMGVSREVFRNYKHDFERAHTEAVEKETKRMLVAMRRDQQDWWKDERRKVRFDVQEEAYQTPVFRALAMLQRGTNPDGTPSHMAPFKLNRQNLVDRYGKEFIKNLPKPWVYSVKGGVDTDVAAGLFGYSDGDALIQDLVRVPKMAAWIEAETDARMRERYPDPLVDGTLADNALVAVHNTKRSQILAAEMRQLRKLIRRDKTIVSATKREATRTEREAREANRGGLPKRAEVREIKAAAELTIAGKKIRDIKPNTYLMAERKAGRLAFEAMGRKDYQLAFDHKRKQIVNLELYRAAKSGKAGAIRIQAYFKKFDKPRVQQRLGKVGVLERILAVIEGISFRKQSLAQLDRDNAMRSLREAVEAGSMVVTPGTLDKILNNIVNWQELTFAELAGMRDIVKQLERMADTTNYAYVNDEKILMADAVNDVSSSLVENGKQVKFGVAERTGGERTRKNLKEGVQHWLRTSSIARILDKSGFGAITQRIVVPIRRAYVEKMIPGYQKASQDVAAIYQKHYSNEDLVGLGKKMTEQTMGENLSRSDLLSIALNWGAEGNRKAMLGGVKNDGSVAYTEQGIRQALSRLTEQDWAFVQDVWDYLDTYWADLSAAEQRRRGIAPEKVEALPFSMRTIDGKQVTLRGGYYPLKYDARHSDRVKADEFEDYFKKMGNGVFVSANTRAGATHNRVQNHGLVVRLGLNTIDQHLREIVRDISIGDEINYVKRLLNDRAVRDAFKATNNVAAMDELNLWLSDAAVGELPANNVPEKALSWIRVGFTKSKLAFNVFTTALQLTGIFQSMAMIGSKWYGIGFGKFLQNPVGMYKHVIETSAFMNVRYGEAQTWDKDVADTRAYLQAFFGPTPTRFTKYFDSAAHYYFWPIAKMQSVVDVTTWIGAMSKARNELGLSEANAKLYADTQVEGSQTSGIFSDRSGLERGTLGARTRQSQFVRIWTTLISYMLAKGNIAYEKTSATNFKKPGEVVQLAMDLVLLYTIEGIASALIYGRWPGDEDEEETIAGWVAKGTADSVISGIPLVREYSAAKFGSGNTPIGAFTKDLWDLQVQAGQGDFDEALIKKGVNVTGTLFHLPSSQLNRAIEAAMAEDAEVYEYLTGTRD